MDAVDAGKGWRRRDDGSWGSALAGLPVGRYMRLRMANAMWFGGTEARSSVGDELFAMAATLQTQQTAFGHLDRMWDHRSREASQSRKETRSC